MGCFLFSYLFFLSKLFHSLFAILIFLNSFQWQCDLKCERCVRGKPIDDHPNQEKYQY